MCNALAVALMGVSPGWGVVHTAAVSGHLDSLEETLEEHPGAVNDAVQGRTALHLGATQGHLDVVQVLVSKYSADVNALCLQGRSPASYAAEGGHLKVVSYLLDNGSDETLLMAQAASQGWVETVEMVVQRSPQLCSPNLLGAAGAGRVEVVKCLLKGVIADNDASDALERAAGAGHDKVVAVLLGNGTTLRKGGTVCGAVSNKEGAALIVDVLLERGEATDAVGSDGLGALHHAAMCGNTHIASILLHHGADPDLSCTESTLQTPLGIAMDRSDLTMATLLIKHGADCTKTAKSGGITPLHIAIDASFSEGLDLLMGNGVDIDTTTGARWSPLHHAVDTGNGDIVECVLRYGPRLDVRCDVGFTPFHAAVSGDDMDVATLLQENGADLDIPCHDGYTALHTAAMEGDLDFVTYLRDCGADPNRVCNNGQTPHQLAEQYGHCQLLSYLK